jgi:hypothetical protein
MKCENRKGQPNRPGDDLAQRYAEILRLRAQIKEAELALANPNPVDGSTRARRFIFRARQRVEKNAGPR